MKEWLYLEYIGEKLFSCRYGDFEKGARFKIDYEYESKYLILDSNPLFKVITKKEWGKGDK